MLNKNGLCDSKWIDFVRTSLLRNGFGYVWYNQGNGLNIECFKEDFKERLHREFVQEWRSFLNESPKCLLYREIKQEFGLESYMYKLPMQLLPFLIKFRTSNHKLEIERGRYDNIERSERICKMCSLNVLGDEYHLLFECLNEKIVMLRKKYLSKNLLKTSSMYKLINLFTYFDEKVYVNLCKFLKFSDVI